MIVFLIGFMGSGKSGLGEKLARKMDWKFLDLDKAIEADEGLTIAEIFYTKGEPYFRSLETDKLTQLHPVENTVVSLGGGTPCSETNWEIIQKKGATIYLKEDESVLFGRLRQAKTTRPLIANLSDAELRNYVQEKIKARKKFYERADLIYEKEKTTVPFLIDQLSLYIK